METKKSVVIVTGASRGLGRSFVLEISKVVGNGSVIFLIARNKEGLEMTKAEILIENEPEKFSDIIPCPMDNSNPKESEFEKMFADFLDKFSEFEQAIIIHNAGSIGNQGTFTRDFCNSEEMQNYFALNLYSAMILNSVFLKRFESARKRIVVNITSLCGVKPFKSFGSYCTGKAARDMFFKVVGEEEKDKNTRVLNFSPGPVDTEMVSEIIEGPNTTDEVRAGFKALELLKPDQPAKKLVKILMDDDYENGQIIDYFDRL